MEELFRILTGFKAYGGEILREQERVDLQSPYDAAKWGFYGFWNEDFEREFFRFYALSRQGDFEGSAKDRKLKNLGRTATLEDMGRLAGGMFRNPYRAVDVPHRDRQKKILDRVDKRPFEIGLFMEPFSMLDLRVQSEFLENLLTEHREQSFLIFSHDLDMLHRFCGRILHLEKGRNKN